LCTKSTCFVLCIFCLILCVEIPVGTGICQYRHSNPCKTNRNGEIDQCVMHVVWEFNEECKMNDESWISRCVKNKYVLLVLHYHAPACNCDPLLTSHTG